MRCCHIQRGFTMVELMITIAIGAILVSLAAPSFRSYSAKKKVEGAVAELANDIQFARSEAVSRNAAVRVTFGTNCYVIHQSISAATCASVPSATVIRTVNLDDTATATLTATNGLTYVEFDTVRGKATLTGTGTMTVPVSGVATAVNAAVIEVATTNAVSSPVTLRVGILEFGRVLVCTANGTAGYSACT